MANPSPRGIEEHIERPYNREEFTNWLTESCRRQHLPVIITNPAVLADIATLLS
ncbi:hypothetical protein [Mycobacteroides abscessus]|uniref:Uncharacterized protein n=2 Tax=Mycobacteroides abscessus TaxID=36809 RepID=A0A0U0ZKW1_9MYCO|nr:hypothetical protein [Mycobacteroides abscessus]EUA70492.1 hypothetical protein I540_2663 [Mycobacteroides abscessus subsp. bolletii 1513]EIU12373.1 hypothetical protein MA5S0304_1539 [Mycobacteroides abscessus 5S-0304]EIU14275.1 hypothetical protein MA5S0421_1791 [Mycobacteroides abscessus 5S-0421]EIU15105.1 hypothetical protein MA5S0422_2473 [Mycobacteroides abscessus 5S-0422]EIU27062.1 hypothetical protein MA5S0708_2015 [Mycobacteroides abscessus 5S-0708]